VTLITRLLTVIAPIIALLATTSLAGLYLFLQNGGPLLAALLLLKGLGIPVLA
jgi:hypothetical protein